MNAIALTDPDGNVFAYLCETCRKPHYVASGIIIGGIHQLPSANQYNFLKKGTDTCCTCRDCNIPVAPGALRCPQHTEKNRLESEAIQAEYAAKEKIGKRLYASTIKKSKDKNSAVLLRHYMSDLSEDRWAAGWLCKLEFILWTSLIKGKSPNVEKFRPHELKALQDYSTAAGGWWHWNESASREIFLTHDEWQKIYNDSLVRSV